MTITRRNFLKYGIGASRLNWYPFQTGNLDKRPDMQNTTVEMQNTNQ